ncbi:hypothetical protein J6590_006300 [Homalodisca vitripennis]|nr:hypothetical protein J6590_006300 [Homalodisca vitripennis]
MVHLPLLKYDAVANLTPEIWSYVRLKGPKIVGDEEAQRCLHRLDLRSQSTVKQLSFLLQESSHQISDAALEEGGL